MTAQKKFDDLKRIIAGHGPMLVAYSGGVDSTLLAVAAKDALGRMNARCVLLDSPVVPRLAVAQAQQTAADLGLALEIISVPLMDHADFCRNPKDRCYICKKASAGILKRRAAELGLACIADGVNASDLGEHRPGLRASGEEGIVHPFIEADISKGDIREIARMLGLPVWSKPSAACLSSRIPYGDPITIEKLKRIEEAEGYLSHLGIGQVRVRLHKDVARIEVNTEEWKKVLDHNFEITTKFRSLGFAYTTLDLEGYRSGSMDEVLH